MLGLFLLALLQGANAASTQNRTAVGGIAGDWIALSAKVKSTDAVFRAYMTQQRETLISEISRVEESSLLATAELKEKTAELRKLRLQTGNDAAENGEAKLGAAANTLVECAHTQELEQILKNQAKQFSKIATSASRYADALNSMAGTSDPGKQAALSEVKHVIDAVIKANAGTAGAALSGLNGTLQTCLESQQKIAVRTEWMNTDRVPALEEIAAIRNGRYVLQDIIDTLKIRQTALVQSSKAKEARLASLDSDAESHRNILQQQLITLSELTWLSKGLPGGS